MRNVYVWTILFSRATYGLADSKTQSVCLLFLLTWTYFGVVFCPAAALNFSLTVSLDGIVVPLLHAFKDILQILNASSTWTYIMYVHVLDDINDGRWGIRVLIEHTVQRLSHLESRHSFTLFLISSTLILNSYSSNKKPRNICGNLLNPAWKLIKHNLSLKCKNNTQATNAVTIVT